MASRTPRNSLANSFQEFKENQNKGTKRKSYHTPNEKNNRNKKRCLATSNQVNINNSNDNNKNDSEDNSKKFKLLNYENLSYQRDKLVNELTPSSTLSSSNFRPTLEIYTPLPNLDFADSAQVWNLMLKNDDLYKRDCNLFTRHSSLQPIMRATVLDWLNEVCQAYNFTRQTYYLTLDFFDRYLSAKENMSKKHLQLLGITCLFIASKIEEIFPPRLDRFSFVCDGACDDAEILAKELVILNTLNWELHPITPIVWLNAYMKICTVCEKENFDPKRMILNESFLIPDYESKLFVQIAHLIDLCTLDAGSLAFSYSVIAASALFHFTNENVILQYTGKTMSELQECIEWMIPFAIAIKNVGFDFMNRANFLNYENDRVMIQTHTISLELLKSAQSIQADLEREKLLESSDYRSFGSMTPSKLPLTPPLSL